MCFLLNSSEKISFSCPQLGHLQTNDFRFLKLSKPGQCCGVLIGHLLYALKAAPQKLSQPRILPCVPAIGDVAGNIHELAFLFAGRTLLRRNVGLDNIPALGTFPFAHIPFSFPAGGAFFKQNSSSTNPERKIMRRPAD
jgi:hypothetical protein